MWAGALAALGLLLPPLGAQEPAPWDAIAAEAAAVRAEALTQLHGRTVDTIAFGSCAKQHQPQPIWGAIRYARPDVFLFIGDNVYADTTDPSQMRAAYAMLAAQPGYQELRRSCPVLATWDDHDYGLNDAGADLPTREISQQLFCDFFGEPPDSPRRRRDGVYDSAVFGPAGRRVQIILLDTRYSRGPLRPAPPEMLTDYPGGRAGRYLPATDDSSTMLGDAQWAWLEKQLLEPAEVRILASSVQVASEEHGFEKWMNLPAERRRLCELITRTRAADMIIISGDRHHGEISRLEGCAPYALLDVTSSGLNQRKQWYNELNRHRLGRVYSEENFGVIHIDWDSPDPAIRLEVRDLGGAPVIRHILHLSELQ